MKTRSNTAENIADDVAKIISYLGVGLILMFVICIFVALIAIEPVVGIGVVLVFVAKANR